METETLIGSRGARNGREGGDGRGEDSPGGRDILASRHCAGFADRGTLLAGALCLILLGLLFSNSLAHMVWTWWSDENYSHGFLVPLISGYFAYLASREGALPCSGGIAAGIILLSVCVFGRLVTCVVPIGVLSDFSMLAGLAGALSMLLGREALRRYAFPLVFLLFMIPLPIALYTAIASPLQHLVSRMGTRLLNLAGIPVLCHGNMMTLPGDVQLFVAEACSGMRQLTGFLALTTAVAWLARRPLWMRLILVCSSIPIAITANVLRVSLTAWLAYAVDPELANGQFHTVEGLLMMGVGLGLLWAECQVLAAIFPESPAGTFRRGVFA
jgi:exosortase